ncbi:MAG: queuosine precursor transporter [Dehalococcoidia bacterium]|nr:queuosine precursor transporter [Dehalococcoidia bacterium]
MSDILFTFNNLLGLLSVLVSLSLTILVFRVFGRDGLYALAVAAVIVANIQVTKTVVLFGLTATLGNVLYGSVFLATDVLSELYGTREARRCVWMGFVAMVLTVLWMQVALWYVPGPDDFAHESLSRIFGLMPRVAAGSLVAYLVSQHHDIFAYQFWRRKTGGRLLWLRNCASTMVSQAIDTVLFCFIALWGVYEFSVWLEILLTTYAFKWAVALLDTPFMYLAVRLGKRRQRDGEASVV